VSNSIQNDISNPGAHNVEVTASDGTIVNLNRERFLPPEVIFNPSLVNNPSQGIAQLIKNCIDKCDPDLKKMLQTNVVLSGGCTSLPGFEVRLHNELQYQYSIISDTDRTHGVIKGEKKKFYEREKLNLTFRSISKHEYDEYGPTVWKYYML